MSQLGLLADDPSAVVENRVTVDSLVKIVATRGSLKEADPDRPTLLESHRLQGELLL
jgi:hypothetical protein